MTGPPRPTGGSGHVIAVSSARFDAARGSGRDDETGDVQLRRRFQVARLLGVVLQSVATEERRRAEEERRRTSEERFRRLFESSPLPMFVVHERSALITRVNRAFTDRYGYRVDDIPNLETQLAKCYPDPAIRASIAAFWKEESAQAKQIDAPVASSVLRICCKDGTFREVTEKAIGFDTKKGMNADVADYGELKYRRRSTGLIYSASLFSIKAGILIGGFLVPLFLAQFGYEKGAATQTVRALLGITLAFSIGPALFALLTGAWVWTLPETKGMKLAVLHED